MERLAIAGLAACGLLAACAEDIGVTRADNGDITVASDGEVTIGPNGSSTNNSQNLTVTFEDGGMIKAIPTDKDGNTVTNYHRLWRDYFINGTVTYDGSDLHSSIAPEFRRSMIATNGTLVISADRTAIYWGSADSNRARNYPLYDVSNVVFAAGRGTISLVGEATLRDDPSAVFENVTFKPSRARLAIAGQGIVSNRTVWSTKRVNFDDYGSEVVLLDESYIPEGVTPVINGNRIFRIRPSDIVVSNETFDSGNNVARVFWRSKEGSGVVPFDIHLGGGTVELQTTRSTYEFAGKIYGSGTIDLQGPNPRTINEIEGAFNFKNSTSSDSTITIRKVNPGSRLRCSEGRVKLVFEEGALPATASRATYGLDTYVFVPTADGRLDTANLAYQNATTAFVPFGADVTLVAGDCHAKIGVTNNAVVNIALDGGSVPTVVGGDGTFAVGMVDWREVVGLWLDASKPYDTSTKGAPYYAPPCVNRSGYDFGNFFFTNGYPFIEAWYDVRGTERTWRLYNSRYYDRNEYKLYTHVYPYLAQGDFAGRTMTYLNCGVNDVANSTWSNDGPDSATVVSNGGGNRRLPILGRPANPVTAIIMVFGSQQGGGKAMLGGGSFARAGYELSNPVCQTAPAGTAIWLDGQEIDPTTTCFNGGWQVVSVVGDAAATVDYIGWNTQYQDAGGQNYAEILFFTNTVTDVQRQQVEAYLAEKWGISTYLSEPPAALPLRAEGRTGSVVVGAEASVELRGTYAGNLTVDGYLAISGEPLPWTAADVPTEGRVDWYDADDVASLELETANAVVRQYPHGKTRDTLTSGCFLWGAGSRMPFAVTGARGLGAERTWLDYNHPIGFRPTTSDGNVLRFIPYNKSPSSGNAVSQTFRTLLVALDSGRGGGGTVIASGSVSGNSGDFRKRDSGSLADPIWPSSCSANVKNGVTRFNGAVVDQAKGFTGAPEVLSLTAAGNVSALCVDTYVNTESANGVLKQQGTVQGEMLMYDSVLDADVLANLEAYLMGKWTGVLPDGWSDLRGATVTAGTGTVSAVAAKLPKFGDGFTGSVAMPDAAFAFTFDGVAGAVDKPFVARGATLDLPAAVAVTVDCVNMQGAKATSVPLFDVAGFANPVAWTLTATNAGGKDLRLREEDGKLMLDLLPGGLTVIFR
ncbi:MAG: hypothetical protein IJL17_04645 [Kiritimatiellae bacterium]|nr:hypothetical protein [Kiritimatiellia bacterium]